MCLLYILLLHSFAQSNALLKRVYRLHLPSLRKVLTFFYPVGLLTPVPVFLIFLLSCSSHRTTVTSMWSLEPILNDTEFLLDNESSAEKSSIALWCIWERKTWKGCQNISKILLCTVNYKATVQLVALFSPKWTGTAGRAAEFAQPALQNESLFLHKIQLFRWRFLNSMSLVKGTVLRILVF